MKTGKHSRYANAKKTTLADLSVRFLAQLKNISREDMEKFVEKAVCLHPHLQSLLPPDEAILSSPPARADVPPWCQCGHCRARRSSYAVANGHDCILQTTEVENQNQNQNRFIHSVRCTYFWNQYKIRTISLNKQLYEYI